MRANVRRSNPCKISSALRLVILLLRDQLRPQSVLLSLQELVLLVQMIVQIALRGKVIDRIHTDWWTLHVTTTLVVEG